MNNIEIGLITALAIIAVVAIFLIIVVILHRDALQEQKSNIHALETRIVASEKDAKSARTLAKSALEDANSQSDSMKELTSYVSKISEHNKTLSTQLTIVQAFIKNYTSAREQ